ncbi:MAG: FAD-binding protein [Planctomycetes bacterium]|nr:FAD-binding protein [Planctomycetota bacterium]
MDCTRWKRRESFSGSNFGMLTPTTQDEVREAVMALPNIRVRGGGTKTALSAGATLSMAGLCGILEYEPGEFTFTALGGTPLATVRDVLAANGQYLPFDPLWTESGATLGGTVSAGLSGPGRFQYGGVRDFLLGVRIVTGEGRAVRGGGKVVKNAAGFDIPKLLVGSLGRLGVITEVTFKVFPAPVATATIGAKFAKLEEAVAMLQRLSSSRLALAALELEPQSARTESRRAGGVSPPLMEPTRLWLRLGGLRDALPGRMQRVREFLGATPGIEVMEDDASLWRSATEFAWAPPDHALVKVPLIPGEIAKLESLLGVHEVTVPRRYSVGGNVAWIAWPPSLDRKLLKDVPAHLKRPLQVVCDTASVAPPAAVSDHPMLLKLQSVFDPQHKLS